jgi:hypothetical protein
MVKKGLFSLIVIVLLSGCGMTAMQKQQVSQFGSATEAMGTFAETQLVQIRQEVVQMNTEILILDSHQTTPKIDLDKPIRPQATLERVAAAKALKSYGSLLNQLAMADRSEDIRKSAGDFVGNFNSALNQGMTDKQKEAATGVLVSLGNMWVEKAKKDSVKKIVDEYKDAVDKLTDLLAQDFLAEGEGFLGGYTAVAGTLKNSAIGALTQGQHPGFLERERALQDYVIAEKAALKAAEIDKRAKIAIENLKKANNNLAKVISEDKYATDDIKSYAKSMKELATMVEIIAGK